ncbi:hypothetical protein GTA08_BOTSDO13813 [Botryosphaeria dothidea]|uniref:DUF7587 domain-containing protein n=1 Tax=Botryosphaeria dothidea TaxID=55169 RepID=A0A8H4J0R6_9PEZI|nr:hypothetical protein GTA08_BOTSDO13813 [Botryosphaeria dothidea]
MSQDEVREAADPQWRKSAITINATNCVISFFHPIINGTAPTTVRQAPERPLPPLGSGIKEESPLSTLGHPSKRPRLASEDSIDVIPATYPESLKEAGNEDRNANEHVPSVEQICKDESEGELPPSAEEELPYLLEKFGVWRDLPESSSVSTTPQKKPHTQHDLPQPDRAESPVRPCYLQQIALPPTPPNRLDKATPEFYRQQYEKLPRKHKPHRWSMEEQEALCLIFRFYQVDFNEVAEVLNEYLQPTMAPFRGKQLHTQWFLLQHIFRKRSLYDPEQAWSKKRVGFEEAAARAGVELRPRITQLDDPKLIQKTPTTERLIAAKDAHFLQYLLKPRDVNHPTSGSAQNPPLASRSRDVDESVLHQLLEAAGSDNTPTSEQQDEDQSDIPMPSPYRPPQTTMGYVPTSSPQVHMQRTPALLYRIYHDESGGLNSPTQFRAGLFNIPGQSLEPPPNNSSILPVFVSWHLWHHSVSSPFISCTDSLVMAMHKARQAEESGLNPHISIIDGAPTTSHRRGFLAAPLVAEAWHRGLVPGMRYKGLREYLIWGEISRESILLDMPLDGLRSLPATHYAAVLDLLALDDIDPAPSTNLSGIRRELLRQEVVLDAPAGHAVGRLVALFGLGLGTAATPAMVEQLVYDVFQGWVLGATDVAEMAGAFLAGLRDASARAGAVVALGEEEKERLKEAFKSGVERALADLRKERWYVRR